VCFLSQFCLGLDLDQFIEATAQGRETELVELFKFPSEGLGFSVVGLRSEHRGDLGIFVQVSKMPIWNANVIVEKVVN